MFGHLFQGRYKAVLVEADNAGYLEMVSTYIHLNPARAGLIRIGREKLKRYRWSSYPWYLKPAGQWPGLAGAGAGAGGDAVEAGGTPGLRSLSLKAGCWNWECEPDGVELEEKWKALRRGWYVGGESFGGKLRERIGEVVRGLRRESHSGAMKREHGEQAAERLVREGMAAAGVDGGGTEIGPPGDGGKGGAGAVVAGADDGFVAVGQRAADHGALQQCGSGPPQAERGRRAQSPASAGEAGNHYQRIN